MVGSSKAQAVRHILVTPTHRFLADSRHLGRLHTSILALRLLLPTQVPQAPEALHIYRAHLDPYHLQEVYVHQQALVLRLGLLDWGLVQLVLDLFILLYHPIQRKVL